MAWDLSSMRLREVKDFSNERCARTIGANTFAYLPHQCPDAIFQKERLLYMSGDVSSSFTGGIYKSPIAAPRVPIPTARHREYVNIYCP